MSLVKRPGISINRNRFNVDSSWTVFLSRKYVQSPSVLLSESKLR